MNLQAIKLVKLLLVNLQERYGFFATAADQVIEQTVNRDNKLAGGIVGITTRPNAVA